MDTPITQADILVAVLEEQHLAETRSSGSSLLEYIDATQRTLTLRGLALRTMRNKLAPIARLPTEIIVQIFAFLGPDALSRKRTRPATPKWHWLTVVKVCKRFHQIAFSTPSLWTTIHATDIRAVREHIIHSSKGPLDIILDDRTGRAVTEFMQVVGPHIGRVRSLQAQLRQDAMYALLPSLTLGPAPQLEHLHLCRTMSSNIHTGVGGGVHPDQSIIVSDIFQGHAPRLKSINLRSISLNQLHIGIFSGLLHLSLDTQNPASTPTMSVFTDILQACPGLQSLSLNHAGPKLPPGTEEYPTPTGESIDLPHLHSLTLDNAAIDISHLLSHLTIPQTCNISLSVEETFSLPEILPRDCSGLGPLLDLTSLKIDITDILSLSILGRCSPTTTATTTTTYPSEPEVWIQMDVLDTSLFKPTRMFADLDSLIPLSSLQDLEMVNFPCDMSVVEWNRILSRVPNLTTLTSGLTEDLAQPMSLLDALGGAEICPRLQGVGLSGVEMTAEVQEAIVRSCTRRDRNGMRLNTLVIPGGLTKEVRASLEEVVHIIDLVDVIGRSTE